MSIYKCECCELNRDSDYDLPDENGLCEECASEPQLVLRNAACKQALQIERDRLLVETMKLAETNAQGVELAGQMMDELAASKARMAKLFGGEA